MSTALCKKVLREKEDIVLQLTGTVFGDVLTERIHLPTGDHSWVRVDSILYAIESGAGAVLYWEGSGDVIAPLEGRGVLDASRFGGLVNPQSPEATGGIILQVTPAEDTNIYHFAITLDLYKQRS